MKESVKKSLLEDKIINLSELVIKRSEYLGLEPGQSEFLAKIFNINKARYDMLTELELAQGMGVNTETVKAIIKPLLSKGLVLVDQGEGQLTFNLEVLVSKLLDTYLDEHKGETSIEDEVRVQQTKDESKQEQVKNLLDKNWLE